tara:strand:+ start:142 stop:561 length:420 start_codon:yes stop_codon:yes gene_type:complete
MATEILVNDGGAPARILPYIALEAISAGEFLTADGTATAKVQLADSGDSAGQQFVGLGWALTDAASGSICNVITGRGVVLNVQTDASMVAGTALMMGSTAGQMTTATNAATAPNAQAVSLSDTNVAGTTAAGLWRVQTV